MTEMSRSSSPNSVFHQVNAGWHAELNKRLTSEQVHYLLLSAMVQALKCSAVIYTITLSVLGDSYH